MVQPAEILSEAPVAKKQPVVYEQPLNERLRTFLRLEYLYQQLLFHMDQPSQWASRAAVSNILDIIAIPTRGDARGDVLKELERQLSVFDRYQSLPDVDQGRLESVLRNLEGLRRDLIAVGPQYLADSRQSEFLAAIKHRSGIPGGTCEFDLPDYQHWLRKPYGQRVEDIGAWTTTIKPLCNSVAELLWLLREGGDVSPQLAGNGVYHHSIGRGATISLIRVCLPHGTDFYPEVSASHHRFTIRFMEWHDVRQRATQVAQDVPFELRLC